MSFAFLRRRAVRTIGLLAALLGLAMAIFTVSVTTGSTTEAASALTVHVHEPSHAATVLGGEDRTHADLGQGALGFENSFLGAADELAPGALLTALLSVLLAACALAVLAYSGLSPRFDAAVGPPSSGRSPQRRFELLPGSLFTVLRV